METGHWSDRLAECCGAVSLAGGAGASALLLAPLFSVVPAALAGVAIVLGAVSGWALVCAVPSNGGARPLATFAVEPVVDLLRGEHHAGELLLDDLIPKAEPSRVVQLFAPNSPVTPGQLQARMAALLAEPDRAARAAAGPPPWAGPPRTPDASEALHAALNEIRRSLLAG